MLKYLRTSITESDAQTVVNTVNTVGVMGKGLALHYKTKFPKMFKKYKSFCDEGRLDVGSLFLWKDDSQWVLNFPTKKHWRNPSKLDYIDLGLRKFVDNYEERGIREISFPRLGCGNGGLNWDDVKPIMEKYLFSLPINVYIHDFEFPIGAPEHKKKFVSDFSLSFDDVLSDITTVINNDVLKTVSIHSNFKAKIEDNYLVFISGSFGKRSIVELDELKEIWSLLMNGPVSHKQLIGRARKNYSYIFGVLSGLPYVEPVQIEDPIDKSDSSAIKLTRKPLAAYDNFTLSASCQGSFKWA